MCCAVHRRAVRFGGLLEFSSGSFSLTAGRTVSGDESLVPLPAMFQKQTGTTECPNARQNGWAAAPGNRSVRPNHLPFADRPGIK